MPMSVLISIEILQSAICINSLSTGAQIALVAVQNSRNAE